MTRSKVQGRENVTSDSEVDLIWLSIETYIPEVSDRSLSHSGPTQGDGGKTENLECQILV